MKLQNARGDNLGITGLSGPTAQGWDVTIFGALFNPTVFHFITIIGLLDDFSLFL